MLLQAMKEKIPFMSEIQDNGYLIMEWDMYFQPRALSGDMINLIWYSDTKKIKIGKELPTE